MEVTIDGKKLTLDGPVTVLEAASRAGVKIPTLCWHPRVSVLGACRLCMIEVEGINRLLAACTTQMSDGMSVVTDSPQLRKVRQTMLELLLCRHPLDCPTCVKGGDCELQALAYAYAAPENRFPENPAPYPVADPSPFIERDPKKCVLCRRCVRVCREVRGVTVLGAMERGYHKRVGTYFQEVLTSDFQEPYNCEFCGACIDICPVGALNSKVRKFRARTWEGSRTPTVCPFCSVGCLLTVQVKEGELVSAVPREGPNNQDQACFRGRFGTDFVNAPSRLVTPMLRRNGEQVPVERKEATRFLAEKLRGGGRTEALVSSSLTQEDVRAVRDFMERVAPGADMRIVDTLGLEEEGGYGSFGDRPWEDLDDGDLIFVAGQDFTAFEPVAGVRVRVSRRLSDAGLVVLDARDALLGGEAGTWLRPLGVGLPLVLGGLIHVLVKTHGKRLRSRPEGALLDNLPGRDAAAVEKTLGLEKGAVTTLAKGLAEKEKVIFLSHRGWYDPAGHVPRLLMELDRMLAGDEAKGIIYLGRDCNSRGASELAAAAGAGGGGDPKLLLLFGTDLVGSAPPLSDLAAKARAAGAVVAFDSFPTGTAQAADAVFPLPHFAEQVGTLVSSSGLEQKMSPAMTPPRGVSSLTELLAEAAEELGASQASSASGDAGGRAVDPGAGLGKGLPGPSLPEAGEKVILLRGVPLVDARLRLVPESGALIPGRVVEINPADLEAFGVADRDKVRVVSGKAGIEVVVRADLKTPRGQVHLPFDGADGELTTFAESAERPEKWPAVLCRLSALDRIER